MFMLDALMPQLNSRMLLAKKNNPEIYARMMNLMDHLQASTSVQYFPSHFSNIAFTCRLQNRIAFFCFPK